MSLNREQNDKDIKGATGADAEGAEKGKKKKSNKEGSVTLSGLLNAIVSHASKSSVVMFSPMRIKDGVAGSEGRIRESDVLQREVRFTEPSQQISFHDNVGHHQLTRLRSQGMGAHPST